MEDLGRIRGAVRSRFLRRSSQVVVAGLLLSAVTVTSLVPSSVAEAAEIRFDVVTAADSTDPTGPQAGDAIAEWQYLINVDNTGDPFDDPADCEADATGNFPAGFTEDCLWPSIRTFNTAAPIVTQGDQDDFAPGGLFAGGIDLPTGKYLISVTAEGHKIGGAHFEVVDGAAQTITVRLDPYPLPLVTLRARVFNDLSTNGQIDLPAEAVAPDDPIGMSGFTATISDFADEVTTDWYGNPLCTEYETNGAGEIILTDGEPTPIPGSGGQCVSDVNGDIVIPNLGPARYAMVVAPPEGQTDWIQTTTLEGGIDHDIWALEGDAGFDTEFNIGGESVPWVIFGYVKPRAASGAATTPEYYSAGPAGTNTIKGVVARYDAYTPGEGQNPNTGTEWGGFSGGKVTGPAEDGMVALLDLSDGDRAIWIGEANADGSFEINGVRDGEYQLTVWEKDILTMLDLFQVTVQDGQILDTGVLGITGWFARYDGHVFMDYNENGRRDPGERGVPEIEITIRGRENNLVENGANITLTDHDGYYEFPNVYPYIMWTVMEAYSDRFHTTGVTYQVSNQNEATTVLGAGVDINVLPVIGQSARIDWGVVPYERGQNGSIAGSVFYDTTRNEYDPRLAAVEDWSVGVPDITLNVYEAVQQPDGEWTKGAFLESTVSETWERPGPCVPRDADGNPIAEQLFFPAGEGHCLEAPLTGIQVDPMVADGDFGAAVNGNFGFGDLDPGKYIVELDIPTDAYGRPLYKVEDEESINVAAGDVYTPVGTAGAPSAGGGYDLGGQMTVGALPTVDPTTQAPGASAICVGAEEGVDILSPASDGYNPPLADAGGTPYQGQTVRGCEAKLIEVLDGRSVAPSFTLYTDVPPPAHFRGYTVDDLNIDTNPRRGTFGEKRGLSHVPIGVYNYAGRLVTQVNADPNGTWEVLLPSTTTMNCPSPSGVCPGMYRFVGNDPGPPTAPFPGFNPGYRTIAAHFQAYPGMNTVADTAPTQVGASVQAPGGQFIALSACATPADEPEVFRVNRPYARVAPGPGGSKLRDLVITGDGLGDTPGELRLVDIDADAVVALLPTDSWTDDEITATIPDDGALRGAYQLEVVRSDGARSVSTVTYHIIAAIDALVPGYNPVVREVGPGKTFATIQAGVGRTQNPRARGVLVVVYPETPSATNIHGAYYENVIVARAVTVQGVGVGGTYDDGTAVHGTVVHGGEFWAAEYDPTQPFDHPEPRADDWYDFLDGIDWAGNQDIADGSVFYVVAGRGENTFTPGRIGRIDGMVITGGDQRGFPGAAELIGIVPPTGPGGNLTTQGGGIFLNSYARSFRITNNKFVTNGGAYGGAIRVGSPYSGDNENDDVVIARNRILANGGSQLAGAIGLFSGAERYTVADNDICGNSSTEYGGGISHYGYSPGGSIHHNRIMLNSAYDEGGGITIAGELPADPSNPSEGAGEVTIRSNHIVSNLSNDDGGGVRFLQAGDFRMDVTNNIIANNVATHQGGGIALDDAPDVHIVNNTVANNLTTATALTSDGLPAPAGLSTTAISAPLLATLPPGSDTFSNPELVNNIFSDNRAGTWAGVAGVTGIGAIGDTSLTNNWDVAAVDGAGVPTVNYSIVDTFDGATDGGGNQLGVDPEFVAPEVTEVQVFQWRSYQRFRSTAIVSVNIDERPGGDYHVLASSPAVDAGTIGTQFDIDDDERPAGAGWDIGADEQPGAVIAQPFTSLLDDFERTDPRRVNSTALNFGLDPPEWGGVVSRRAMRIQDNPDLAGDRNVWIRRPGAQIWLDDEGGFGDSQEAWVTIDNPPSTVATVGVVLRATGLNRNDRLVRNSSYAEVAYAPYLGGVIVRTKRAGDRYPVIRATISTSFGTGDTLLGRIGTDGNMHVLRLPAGGSWELLGVIELGLGSDAWPAPGTDRGGRIGMISTLGPSPAFIDEFSGGRVL